MSVQMIVGWVSKCRGIRMQMPTEPRTVRQAVKPVSPERALSPARR